MAETKGYVATTKFLIASPTKVRPVAHAISRMPCSKAVAVLENMPQKGAKLIGKTLKSAMANALVANDKLGIWCRARGRADQLLKRMCHITVTVAEKAGE